MAYGSRIPVWRRLGIKLDSETPGTEAYRRIQAKRQSRISEDANGSGAVPKGPGLSEPSLANRHEGAVENGTLGKRNAESPSNDTNHGNGFDTTRKRRKSVTFTPETKELDGDINQHVLEEWAKEQTGGEGEFSRKQAAEFLSGSKPTVATANGDHAATPTKRPKKDKSKDAKDWKPQKLNSDGDNPLKASHTAQGTEKPAKLKEKKEEKAAGTGPETHPSYLDYVVQYQTDRQSWKFNKTSQKKLLKHVFDVSLVSEEYDYAVFPYISGLQSGGLRMRLKEEASKILSTQPAAGVGDVYEIPDDDDEGMRKRRRKRAEAVLHALSSTSATAETDTVAHSSPKSEGHAQALGATNTAGEAEGKAKEKRSRKRKNRTE